MIALDHTIETTSRVDIRADQQPIDQTGKCFEQSLIIVARQLDGAIECFVNNLGATFQKLKRISMFLHLFQPADV